MYKLLRSKQNTFFSSAADVLSHCKQMKVKRNNAGLYYLEINGSFKASFHEGEKEDVILFYGNQLVQRNLNKG